MLCRKIKSHQDLGQAAGNKNVRQAISRILCPLPGGDHSSRPSVATRLKQSTRIAVRERTWTLKPSHSYLTLLQIGFFQMRVTTQTGELLPRLFILTGLAT